MCGRYSLTTPVEALARLFGFAERPNLLPRVNIAPGQEVAVLRADEAGTRHFAWLRWGLVPCWAKDEKIGYRMINARAESVAEKPAFRAAFRKRRCLVLADGFYEWRAEKGGKQPYRITLADGRPFAFAGLWESWENAGAERPLESCTIVTTVANARLRALHDRMPVILEGADGEAWLDPATPAAAARTLLRPFAVEKTTYYPVSRRLNSPAVDDPSLLAPTAGEVPPPDASSSAPPDVPEREPRLL